ncbi:hypothetical protein OG339_48080 (plasmid) [Streptosporangium sp. NBC_01495]|uniref:hypothetical protein n=1 Tax=Streptosporangium sp. NBC_01495 TaxID=2903899 RepID=UPI002E34713B|nr:hypothetical protein [Streptosporangium sp. NBC_01495]
MTVTDIENDLPIPEGLRLAWIETKHLDHNPDNVREDFNLTPAFVKSIAFERQVPLSVVPIPEDYERKEGEEEFLYWVIKGNRRLAGAREGEVPRLECLIDLRRAGDRAGQFMDMYTEHEHRKGLTIPEQVLALFQARQSGATKKRIADSTGLSAKNVTAGITAGEKLSGAAQRFVQEMDYEWTFLQLSELAEFTDEETLNKIRSKMRWNNSFEHAVSSVRAELKEAAEHAQQLAELKEAGVSVTETLPAGALILSRLSRETGVEVDAEAHRTCPGNGAYFSYGNTLHYYCASPDQHGYTSPEPVAAVAAAPVEDPEVARRERRIVREGRREWGACAQVRQKWLQALLARATAPKPLQAIITRLTLAMPEPLRERYAGAHTSPLWSTMAGSPKPELADTAKAGRLPLLQFARIAVAFEHQMTQTGEAANTWRTRWSPCSREDAALWLRILQTLGYDPALLERSLIEDFPYQGEDPDAYNDDEQPGESADNTADETSTDDLPDLTGDLTGDLTAPEPDPETGTDDDSDSDSWADPETDATLEESGPPSAPHISGPAPAGDDLISEPAEVVS